MIVLLTLCDAAPRGAARFLLSALYLFAFRICFLLAIFPSWVFTPGCTVFASMAHCVGHCI